MWYVLDPDDAPRTVCLGVVLLGDWCDGGENVSIVTFTWEKCGGCCGPWITRSATIVRVVATCCMAENACGKIIDMVPYDSWSLLAVVRICSNLEFCVIRKALGLESWAMMEDHHDRSMVR